MKIISNETVSREGNECLIYKSVIVGYVEEANTYIVTKLKWYVGSWTPHGVSSDCENYTDEYKALREAEEWLHA